MKKLVLISILFLSFLEAKYWDCSISFSSQRWDMVAYGDDVIREIEADSRSRAESKANDGFWATKKGFFSSKSIYICPNGYGGSSKHDGHLCYYSIRSISCSSQ